jgi:hypothetical protein
MFREKENKWTRERSFLEVNGGDIVMVIVALFFLAMTIGGIAFVLIQPRIPGLHELFSDPPPPPPPDQKLHLDPGESEMRLYPGKPIAPPPPKK